MIWKSKFPAGGRMCRCAESRKGTRLVATDVGLPKPYARRANPGSEGPEPRPGSRAREDSAAPLFQELRARRAARFLSLTTCTRLQVYRKYSAWSCRWLFETWIRKNKRLKTSFMDFEGGTVLGERTQRDSSPAESEPGLAPRVAAFCWMM